MTDSAKVIRLEPEVQRHVRARLARLPAGVHALNTAAKKVLTDALVNFFDAADDTLFELADTATTNSDQNLYFDSMREVRVQRRAIETRFLNTVEEAFARLVAVDERDFLKDNGELSAEALSLVQNEDLEQLVAVEAMVGRANKAFAPLLTALCSALSSVMSVQVDDRSLPFGPHVLCAAMLAQVKRLDIGIKAKLSLFELFDKVVIQCLSACYGQLLEVLKANKIRVYVPDVAIPNAADEPVADSSSLPMPANRKQSLREALGFVQRLPVSCANEDGIDVEQLLVKLRAESDEPVEISRLERETIRLVQMMFQLILRAHKLAPPLRELFCRLQVPVLRMSLQDPGFLQPGQEQHPARRLLNEFASVATRWGDAEAIKEDDALLSVMRSTVDKIQTAADVNAEVFHAALADFSAFLESEQQRAAMLEKRTVDAEDGKARAEMVRKRVAAEIVQRMPESLPTVVQDLLNGPWSNVLFITGLKYGVESELWHEQLGVVTDLVWSVQERHDKRDRQNLIRMVPDLMQRMRRGLEGVSYNPFEVSELFSALEEIHLTRIRGDTVSRTQPVDETVQEQPSAAVEPKADAPQTAGHSAPAEEVTELPPDDPHMRTVTGFSQGAWFDLNHGSENAIRCRLAAFIRPTGKYIFVDRSGAKVAEKTQQELARDLKEGRLRNVDNSMLFDKALESVVSSLRKRPNGPPLDLE